MTRTQPKRRKRPAFRLTAWLGAAALVAVLWSSYDQAQGGIQAGQPTTIHPDPRYLDRPDGVPVRAIGEDLAGVDSDAATIVKDIAAAKLVASLGQPSGPPETIFGSVLGAAFDRAGMLYVLDGAFFEVRVFEADGDYVTTIGGKGQGPGELMMPVAIAVDDNQLLIGEDGFELELYDISEGTIRHRRRLVTNSVPVHGICSTGGGFILGGPRYEPTPDDATLRVVHILNPEGESTASFGTLYRSPVAMLNTVLSEALIACVPEHDVIIVAPKMALGEVRAYDTSGDLRWIAELQSFAPNQQHEYAVDGSVRYRNVRPPDGFDRIESILQIGRDRVIVQVGRVVQESHVDPFYVESVKSYVINVSNGSGTSIGTDIPVLLAADPRRFATLEEVEDPSEPYLRVRVYEWATPIVGWGEQR